MTTQMDVRCHIYCNLGTVISGSIQDASLIGAGLVPTTGTLQLAGIYDIKRGDPVELAYYRNGVIARLGKKMRVLASFSNPITKITEVSIGCLIAYHAETAPITKMGVASRDDPERTILTPLASLVTREGVGSRYIINRCLEALDIKHAPTPTENRFATSRFDVSGPYLQTVSDLLVSENYVGFMGADEKLRYIDLTDQGGTGPVLDESRIVDITPLSTTANVYPEADVVYSVVSNKAIRLDAAFTA